ncbi:hypothetical protein EU522_01170 [Candidatus Thorarchaeota archaeon]|nr:MAG: hypothetical protein EU522_01170 [Candidatus Thorarchaeota archaeon]
MKKLLVTLTPAEGKRLIAKGLLATNEVKQALKEGYLCVTLGSTSAYLVEEILGEYDKTRHIAGVTVPKGLAVTDGKMRFADAIFHKGKHLEGKKVIDVLDELGPNDVIIKSANALGNDYVPIVLLASKTAGTVGTFIGAAAARNITVIMPVGLEKSIPTSYNDFSAEFGMNDWDYTIGTPVGAISIPSAIAFTEIEALDMLFDVSAIPIAAGGVNGAEGAITFYISGDDKNIKEAYEFLLTIKGEPSFPHVKHVK